MIQLLSILLFSTTTFAQTLSLSSGQVYQGIETFNERATGQICYITIHKVQPHNKKGLHCYRTTFSFNSNREDLPKSSLSVETRVTNYHRDEFPKVKTCALNIDGTTFGDEIYQDDTSILFNRILSGAHVAKRTNFDYFITIDPYSKLATRARVHVTKLFQEYDVDCINLSKM